MPKIFLIKNRLHQQQLRLLESQKRAGGDCISNDAEYLTPPGSPLSSECRPVALVVPKPPVVTPVAPLENKPASSVIKAKASNEPSENECAPRRFFSSILGGEKPYARHVAFEDRGDPAKRQIDAAKFPISKKIAAALKAAAAAAPKCQQVSVIQRGPTLSEKIAKGFNIHINGTLHCSVRYRQLLCLHEQLKRELEQPLSLPPFPPKKLLMSQGQLDERRLMLEKYLQTASQDLRVSNSDLFRGFLLSAQLESSKEISAPICLEVFLMNGQKISLDILTSDPSDDVLENLSQKLHLAPEYVKYFSLYLIRKDEDSEISVIKRLEQYESPYISMKSLPGPHRIVLRKNFWDLSLETKLAEDRVALNLLYTQAIWEVERGWILASKDIRNKLSSLQSRGEKREYLELAKGLKYYGFMQFGECWCDYPQKGTRVVIAAGNRELNFRVRLHSPDASSSSSSSDSSETVSEGSFRVTRMRCWRITTLHTDEESEALGGCVSPGPRLELSFEYLMSKDRLQWITVVSEQAILMSACLQAMVAELLAKKVPPPANKAQSRPWSFMRRDGTFQRVRPVQRSVSNDAVSEASVRTSDSVVGRHDEGRSSIKRLSGRLSGVALKGSNSPSSPANPFVENHAFDGIGDDDL